MLLKKIFNFNTELTKSAKLIIISSILLIFWWMVLADNDLLYETIRPSQEEIIFPWSSEKTVWAKVFNWETKVSIGKDSWITSSANLFAKVTRLLLMLVITLSITMILYNWIKYIVEDWQWKDSKNLKKNVAYIVVWILLSLFSVIIITLLRSVPTTIDEGIEQTNDNSKDNQQVEGGKQSLKDFFKKL